MATHIKHAITLNCKGRHKHHILKWLSTHGYSHQTCSKDIRSKDPAFRLFAALLLPKLLTFESLPMPVPNCIARLTLAAALGKPSLLNAALSNSLSPCPGASFKFATSHRGSCKTAWMYSSSKKGCLASLQHDTRIHS